MSYDYRALPNYISISSDDASGIPFASAKVAKAFLKGIDCSDRIRSTDVAHVENLLRCFDSHVRVDREAALIALRRDCTLMSSTANALYDLCYWWYMTSQRYFLVVRNDRSWLFVRE